MGRLSHDEYFFFKIQLERHSVERICPPRPLIPHNCYCKIEAGLNISTTIISTFVVVVVVVVAQVVVVVVVVV